MAKIIIVNKISQMSYKKILINPVKSTNSFPVNYIKITEKI